MGRSDRDDFTKATIDTLANRAGNRCSNPNCRKPTSGPRTDPVKAINIGVAAHITAASLRGPRYDPSLTSEQRRHPNNGIWLCQNCAKLIDNDPQRYPVRLLHQWKEQAEHSALQEIEQRVPPDPLHQRPAPPRAPTPNTPGSPPLVDPDKPPIASIRKLLLAAFTPQTLWRFCQDRPAFCPLLNEFSPSHGLNDMVDRVIDYCQTHLVWNELLVEVKGENPQQYDRFEQQLHPSGKA